MRERVLAALVGGLVGGALFGALMELTGMIEMVAGLVGSQSPTVGWIVHLAISLALGLGFGLIVALRPLGIGASVGLGAAYGLVWWVLGALLIMPAAMDMPVLVVDQGALMSLAGHLVYGVALGAVTAALAPRLGADVAHAVRARS